RVIRNAIDAGRKLSPAAQAYALQHASVRDLLRMEKTEAVYRAILSREDVELEDLRTALDGLAAAAGEDRFQLLIEMIQEADARRRGSIANLGTLLLKYPPQMLSTVRPQLEQLARSARLGPVRRLAFAAWITADRAADDAFAAAAHSEPGLRAFFKAIPQIADADVRAGLFAKVRPLLFDLPGQMDGGQTTASADDRGLLVEYFTPSPPNAAIETFDRLTPADSGVVAGFRPDVPQVKRSDNYGLKFSGVIQVQQSGKYTFTTRSDDGSRLYIGNKLVVNNDGWHGTAEKKGLINLTAGSYPLVVTYFNGVGGRSLEVFWSGPEFRREEIPVEQLSASGETLHDLAIRTLTSIPGHQADKFQDLVRLMKAGRYRSSAIRALREIPASHWVESECPALADYVVAYLGELPTALRTSPAALDAVELARQLADKLPEAEAQVLQDRLHDLEVRVIPIGTVP
ncbi:MAG: hypothetical protein GTO03_14025, partial [Planctomycetales bacterium]|nr:hypothetical protein [Planctomycetales bacterium]